MRRGRLPGKAVPNGDALHGPLNCVSTYQATLFTSECKAQTSSPRSTPPTFPKRLCPSSTTYSADYNDIMFVATPNKSKKQLPKRKPRKSPPLPLTSTPPNQNLTVAILLRTSTSPPPPYGSLYPSDHAVPALPPRPRPPPTLPLTANRAPFPVPTINSGYGSSSSHNELSRLALEVQSYANDDSEERHEGQSLQAAHSTLHDRISSKFCAVITSIDGEEFAGRQEDLEIRDDEQSGIRGGWGPTSREVSRGANRAISSAVISTNYFAKANLYANSKLPPNLPPLKLLGMLFRSIAYEGG